jgi:hypothetical protein
MPVTLVLVACGFRRKPSGHTSPSNVVDMQERMATSLLFCGLFLNVLPLLLTLLLSIVLLRLQNRKRLNPVYNVILVLTALRMRIEEILFPARRVRYSN